MSWDKNDAVRHLQSHAEAASRGHCARYVRNAIERGGIKLKRTQSARNYGPSLLDAGFHDVTGRAPLKGDVIVIQAIPGHPDGHMAMYDGQIWISDFRQRNGVYPGQSYRTAQPAYKMYRHE
ncbi:MAG TPA: CHAP domain-containing protein [Paraburkholderia sp.]|jgi:hypothetical protein|nr:CHAP domain-containing protein [Paraburkholderia sp.]